MYEPMCRPGMFREDTHLFGLARGYTALGLAMTAWVAHQVADALVVFGGYLESGAYWLDDKADELL